MSDQIRILFGLSLLILVALIILLLAINSPPAWKSFNGDAYQQEQLQEAMSLNNPLARHVYTLFDQDTDVIFASKTCAMFNEEEVSCALLKKNVLGKKEYRLELDIEQTTIDGGDFTIWHELGHLADYELFNAKAFEAFGPAFKSSPAWLECFKTTDGKCMAEAEIFADQWAYWASASESSIFLADSPKLLADAHFEAIVKQQLAKYSA